jgi:pimeloyl-ACP methyl ester carboxylesterase
MEQPRLNHVQCLSMSRRLHRVAYWEWGDPANPRVLVCVHGLTRQGRDFDVLAQAMAGEYRVVCPDVAGRGESDRLADPMSYIIPTYVSDMVTVLARVNAETVHWVGTSMGGLIGLGISALPGSPVSRLVLNDVGPAIEAVSLQRIGGYLGQNMSYPSFEEGAEYLKSISAGFGPHSRERWHALSRPMFRQAGGGVTLHYDPQIALAMRGITEEQASMAQAALWGAYDSLKIPTLVLRGANSDLLSPVTAKAMTERGPKATLHQFDGIGHAPMLVEPEQIKVVREFLLAP